MISSFEKGVKRSLKNIERELKYLIDKQRFRRLYKYLCKHATLDSVTRQVNHYLDTESFSLQNNKISVRIRTKKDYAELTCKMAKPSQAKIRDFMQSDEYTKPLSLNQAYKFLKKGLPADILQDLIPQYEILNDGFDKLICHGRLRTTRLEFIIDKTIEPLLLDINRYLGTFDYELEWETDNLDKARALLYKLFSSAGITFDHIPKVMTKRRRYFERLAILSNDNPVKHI